MRAFVLLLLLSCFATTAFALDVAGVPVEAKASVEQRELSLNGAGLRSKYFFRVYVAALYVQEPSSNAGRVISQPGSKRMQLLLLRGLSAKQLVEALQQGLEQNLGAASLEAMQPRLAAFEKMLEGLRDGRKGDKLALDFMPGAGTQIRLNGVPQGAPVAGEDFYQALLMIWLGGKPVQDSLKRELLTNNR